MDETYDKAIFSEQFHLVNITSDRSIHLKYHFTLEPKRVDADICPPHIVKLLVLIQVLSPAIRRRHSPEKFPPK